MAGFPGAGSGQGHDGFSGFGHGVPFDGLFDRLLNDFFGDGFREFEEMQRRMESEIRVLQGGFEDMQTQPPAEGQQSLRKRLLTGPGESLPRGQTGQTPRQQLLTDNNTLTMDNNAYAYVDTLRDETKEVPPKNGWLTLWSNIDMDEDRRSQWTVQQPTEQSPVQTFSQWTVQQPTEQSPVQTFSSSSSRFSSGGGGTFESKHTVRDAQGNVETTVTKRSGNQETTVVTTRRPDGTEVRTEHTVDLGTNQLATPVQRPASTRSGLLSRGPSDGLQAQGPAGWLSWLWGRGH